MKYTIFAHESLYHLKEEINNCTGDEIEALDWQSWEYTINQWPHALEDMRLDFGYVCIMDRAFRVVREWTRKE